MRNKGLDKEDRGSEVDIFIVFDRGERQLPGTFFGMLSAYVTI